MKKTLWMLLLGSSLLLTGFLGCEKKKSTDLIVGTSADYKPFMFYENGALTGFEKDVLDELAKRMKRNPQYKDMSFDSLLGALQTNHVNLVAASVTPTEERRKNVDFSKPYHISKVAFILRADSPVQGMDDLKNVPMGVQMGTTHEQRAQEWVQEGNLGAVTTLSKIPELLQELAVGRVQVIMLGETEAKGVVAALPELKLVVLQDLAESSIAFALPKGSADLEEINKTLDEMEKDGTLAALSKKWNL